MSRPNSLMRPSVGSSSRSTVRATVDLPHPLSPTSPKVSPGPIEKLTPSTARTWPKVRRMIPFLTGKCFLRSLTSSSGAPSTPAPPVALLELVPIKLNHLLLPPLEKGRVGVGIALHILRPLSVARDPLLTSPFQGEECVNMSGTRARRLLVHHEAAPWSRCECQQAAQCPGR